MEPLQPKLKMPKGTKNKVGKSGFFPNGNFVFTDRFKDKQLDYRWIGVRGPREDFIALAKGGLQINPFPTTIDEVKPTSTLFYRQQHKNFTATTTRSEEHTSELQSLMRISYAVFCLNKKNKIQST